MTDDEIDAFEVEFGMEYDPYYDDPYTEEDLPDVKFLLDNKVIECTEVEKQFITMGQWDSSIGRDTYRGISAFGVSLMSQLQPKS